MTLRTTLILSFIVACGLPLMVFWLWPHSEALEAEMEAADERHLLLAKAAAETLSVYKANVHATFDALSDRMLAGEDIGFARPVLEAQSFTHFCVVDRETGAVLDLYSLSDRPLPETLPAPLLEELHRRIAKGDRTMRTVWQGARGAPQLLIARAEGDRIVFASVNAAFIGSVARKIVFDRSGHAVVLDAQGRVLAHPDPGWVASAHDLSQVPEIGAHLETDAPGVIVFHSPALEEKVVAGIAPVERSGWWVLVPQPLSDMRAHVVEGRVSASLVFSAGLALSLLVALVTATLISRPLREIATAADAMAGGAGGIRLAEPRRSMPSELAGLRASFNQMAARTEAVMMSLKSLARQDSLTGLLNKRSFQEEAVAAIAAADCLPEGMALYAIDLDNLKSVNDLHGHAAGDAAIRAVARLLPRLFPDDALIARAGGDEFLVFTRRIAGTGLGDPVGALREGLEVTITGKGPGPDAGPGSVADPGSARAPDAGASVRVFCSIGVALCAGEGCNLFQLVDEADQAMYVAKRRAKGLQVYDAALRRRTERRTDLSAELRRDVAAGRIGAAFQPIFDAGSGAVVEVETLARWQPRGGAPVPPSEFLRLAQDGGFVSELDRGVRRHAMALVRDLRARGHGQPVAVNVTALDLARTEFVDQLSEDLAAAGLTGRDLVLEVTEAIFDDRYGLASETLVRLAAIGVAVHLDDFGKGFSSHGLLTSVPFEAVKVDMRFAGDPSETARARAILSSLVALGRHLGMSVTLEGIETERDRTHALSVGATRLQGFLLARPMGREGLVGVLAGAPARERPVPPGDPYCDPGRDPGRITARPAARSLSSSQPLAQPSSRSSARSPSQSSAPSPSQMCAPSPSRSPSPSPSQPAPSQAPSASSARPSSLAGE